MACLAHSRRQSCGWIADGDDDNGFFCLRHPEEFMATLGIEVAYPTTAKALLCGSQTKMLYGDGHIDVAVRLAVFSYPFLLMKQRGKDIQRSFVEPRTLVAQLELLPTLLAADNAEPPRLSVHRRRSKSHTFLYVRNLLLLYRFVKITATTVAALYDVNKASQR